MHIKKFLGIPVITSDCKATYLPYFVFKDYIPILVIVK